MCERFQWECFDDTEQPARKHTFCVDFYVCTTDNSWIHLFLLCSRYGAQRMPNVIWRVHNTISKQIHFDVSHECRHRNVPIGEIKWKMCRMASDAVICPTMRTHWRDNINNNKKKCFSLKNVVFRVLEDECLWLSLIVVDASNFPVFSPFEMNRLKMYWHVLCILFRCVITQSEKSE